jgi:chromosome segregation ATPase
MEDHNSSRSATESPAALSASALRELQQRAHDALAASREQAAKLEADITRQLDAIAASLKDESEAGAVGAAEAGALRAEITRLTGELESSKNAWLAERIDLEFQRDDLVQKTDTLETQLQSSQTEWRNQLLDFENRLREQQNSWTEQRSEWSATRASLERERDEGQQKFDLALQDVQRLRARVAEMEQDLARRPEPNQADSAELVALRAERDALAARVEELDKRPAAQIDPNVEQQLADLQRRFEMAVEDVRELKTKNAKLESQLAAGGSRSPAPQEIGDAMDWESQKRRLLAALEDGHEANNPVQKKDRATIESTIEITDAVVAEKDRQIAELQTQLATAGENAASEVDRNRRINELVDSDEVIAEHRQRVRELEREMEEKLRTAELELSVERAKMARQKVELDELKADLEAKRQAYEVTGTAPGQAPPKRRWRSKLGLTGDE